MDFTKLPSKGISVFSTYKEIFAIVSSILKLVLEYEKKDYPKEYAFLINKTKDLSQNVLSCLSKGYNKFNSDDKAEEYILARDYASSLESNLLLLIELNILPKDETINQYVNLETKLSMFNGIIRKMEQKE